MGAGTFEERTHAYTQWLNAHGIGMLAGVEIGDYRNQGMGRGLKLAHSTAVAGTSMFNVPASAALHAGILPEVVELAEKYDLDNWSALIVTMMAVQTTPRWAPYFDVLPTEFNTPMFWSPEEINALSPSEVVNRIGRESADELYDSLATGVLKEPFFKELSTKVTSRDSFHRCGSIIMSYAFDIPVRQTKYGESAADGDPNEEEEEEDDKDEDEETVKVLIPLADLINESATTANVEFSNGDLTAGLTCASTREIIPGEQLLLKRHSLSSSEMLRRFGYVDPADRTVESVEIPLDLVRAQAIELAGDESAVDAQLARLKKVMGGELPETFESSVVLADSEEQLDYDDDLLVVVTALAVPKFKVRELERAVDDFTERQTMSAEAKTLLKSVLRERRAQYGTTSQPESTTTRVSVAQYVLWSESDVLDRLMVGLDAILPEGPATKRIREL